MKDFTFYFDLGWRHIISLDSMDHILFIIALTAIYQIENSKQVLILITSFTIGHSLTLFLSVNDLFKADNKWVEFLIPLTVIFTAVFNFTLKEYKQRSFRLNYFLALFFGLIHGMGFANTIRFLLAKDQQLALPLLGFNLGLEAGQLLIVLLLLLLAYLLLNKASLNRTYWVWSLSALALVPACYMAIERFPY